MFVSVVSLRVINAVFLNPSRFTAMKSTENTGKTEEANVLDKGGLQELPL